MPRRGTDERSLAIGEFVSVRRPRFREQRGTPQDDRRIDERRGKDRPDVPAELVVVPRRDDDRTAVAHRRRFRVACDERRRVVRTFFRPLAEGLA